MRGFARTAYGIGIAMTAAALATPGTQLLMVIIGSAFISLGAFKGWDE